LRVIFLLLQRCDQEYNGEYHAQRANYDVADCEEVVLSSKRVSGGQHEALVSVKSIHIVLIVDGDLVGARLNVLLNFTVKLAEVGKASSSHPHDEVL